LGESGDAELDRALEVLRSGLGEIEVLGDIEVLDRLTRRTGADVAADMERDGVPRCAAGGPLGLGGWPAGSHGERANR
jgi:hypothetical protein